MVACCDDGFAGEGGVVFLVRTAEVKAVSAEGLSDEGQGSLGFVGNLANRFFRFEVLGGTEKRFAAEGDGSFFSGDGI